MLDNRAYLARIDRNGSCGVHPVIALDFPAGQLSELIQRAASVVPTSCNLGAFRLVSGHLPFAGKDAFNNGVVGYWWC